MFLFAIWLIWKNRNQFVFKGRSQYPNLAKDIKARALEYMHCACSFTATKKWVLRRIRWEKPDTGWMKLNTDGASSGSLGLAGGGGVIRDEERNWVVGYARKIGSANSFLAELWALRDGLFLCLQAHIQAVIIEMDAKGIVDAFSHQKNANPIISSLMDDCRQLVSQILQSRFRHVYREVNRSADCMAKLGTYMGADFTVFSSPPVDVIPFFEADSHGLFVSRRCPDFLLSV